MNISILLFLNIFLVFGIISQLVVRYVVRMLFNRIVDTAQDLEKVKDYKDSDIKKEAANLATVKTKKEKLGFITYIIGVGEIIVFGCLTELLIKSYYSNILGGVSIFFKFLGGWLAIKTLGNYQQWAGAILGRACFYVFIIGTFLNILFAVIFGIVLFDLSTL